MHLHIDPNSSRPIIRQVVEQIHWQIVSGRLHAGDRLPSIRELSKQLGINPTTVTRIYSEMANTGVIVLRQGQGAFVAEQSAAPRVAPDDARRKVGELACTMLVEGLKHGMTKREIDEIVSEEFRKIRSRQE